VILTLALIVVALMATLVACVPPNGVVLRSGEWGTHTLLVDDRTGLLAEVRAATWETGVPLDEATVSEDGMPITIHWTGGACEHSPTLTVSGDAAALSLVVRNPPDETIGPPAPCPAVGIPLGAVLTLSEPVVRRNVSVDLGF
jgi:hypothetical protein